MAADPMLLLNLGCGSKTSPRAVNIDWSIMLRMQKNPLLRTLAPLVVNKERLERMRALSGQIMVHDLSKGIPFPDGTADAVYLSHVLEHIDRGQVPGFLAEMLRVLKPGGVVRLVVPDLEHLARTYLESLETASWQEHEQDVSELLEQSVRREAFGTSQQKPLRRFVENRLLGDARKRGETHQWMYDRATLPGLLAECGFTDPKVQDYATSAIPDWPAIGLDTDEQGREYKPHSLYVEAVKPA